MPKSPCLIDRHLPRGSFLFHRGKFFLIRSAGSRTLALLRDVAYSPECQSLAGLIRLRPRIRKVIEFTPPLALSCVLDTCDNPRVLRLAIWISGRARVHHACKSIARRASHDDFRVRREAIRSLRRLSAWAELRRIASGGRDDRTRRLAMTSDDVKRLAYGDRLKGFLSCTHPQQASQRHHPLVISPNLDMSAGKSPRSRGQIRNVLRRIQLLIRQQRRRRWSW